MQPLGFQNEDTLYINFDAFWDNFTAEEMKNALELVRKNGHRPGTYWTPFAFWGSPTQFRDVVEGTNGKYTYGDILLRDSEGEILPDVDGGLAIDPTHPGNLQRIDWYTKKFISEGFEYIKLDFLKTWRTGIPASQSGDYDGHCGVSLRYVLLAEQAVSRGKWSTVLY